MAEEFTCPVDEIYRSACKDLPKYSGSRYCVLHEPGEAKKEDFLKEKKSKLDRRDYDFGGTIFPDGTSDFRGFEFDAAANFNGATFVGAADFADAQFNGKRTDFRRVRFRGWETTFSNAQFSGDWTDFSNAQFTGQRTFFSSAEFRSKSMVFLNTHFSGEWTDFSNAQFSADSTQFPNVQFSSEKTRFTQAEFSGDWTDFSDAQFSGQLTDFSDAQFDGKQTEFLRARFSCQEATFLRTSFKNIVSFNEVIFSHRITFLGSREDSVFGSNAWTSFNQARMENPELITFHSVLLHPGWFVNIDVRKVDFTDVKWYGMPGGPKGTLNEEIDNLKKRDIESPHSLLAQACRRLSANAEENREYPLANEFYYWSMNALRKAGWRRLGLIGTLYWALSGYGVRARRAFGWLVVIWVVFALLYMLMGSKELHVFSASEAWKYVAQHILTNSLGLRAPSQSEIKHFWADVRPALVYSLGALARLRPEPQPDGPSWFQFFVTVEGILGPLQVALLALAIRRKVMR